MPRLSNSFVALVLLVPLSAAAEPALTVTLDGHEQQLTRSALESLGVVVSSWTAHGHTAKVKGVPLDRVLEKVGFTPGPMGKNVPKSEKRSGWKKIVVAAAPDGFSAVFSCAELMPAMGTTRAMVIWEADGQTLPADQGPFRIVVLTDQEASRSIYAVSRIDIIDTRKWAAH